jgi:peptide/nickel transport system substrate-binding protein
MLARDGSGRSGGGMVKTGIRSRIAALGALLVSGFLCVAAAQAETTVRMVPQADLKILDPVWSSAQITQNHAYLVFDTLFAMDGRLQPRPQMVESWQRSEDGLSWSFALRPGMTFHDGSPVTARDAVASIRRWSQRQPGGLALTARTSSLEATGDLSFVVKLKERFEPVLNVLATPTLPLVIMREKDAATDAFTQLSEAIGSGPFVFAKDEWVPGNKVVYRKFKDYKPRAEPADGFAGGKVAKVDRVEWVYIPDDAIATQALSAGEVDILEQPTYDLLPVLKANPKIVTRVLDPLGRVGTIRPNFLHPPFDNVKARQALQLLVDQKTYLAAMVGNPDYERPCYAALICGSPLATEKYTDSWRKQDIARAKQLFKEAGYSGEPVVILKPSDQQLIGAIAEVTADLLRQAGVAVDVQTSDWGTITTRRTRKDKPGPGSPGWNIFVTWWIGLPMSDPLTSTPIVATCDGKNWFGWACDDEMERRRAAYLTAETDAEKRQAAEAIQQRFYEFLPYATTGQFLAPIATRNTVSGIVNAPLLVFWNMEKAS